MTETTRPSRLASAVGKLNGLTPDEVAELEGTKVASLTAQARQIVDRRAYIERNRQHRPHVPLDVLADEHAVAYDGGGEVLEGRGASVAAVAAYQNRDRVSRPRTGESDEARRARRAAQLDAIRNPTPQEV